MEILLASGNTHKKREFAKILANHRILLPSEIGINFDCEETGETYLENALLKAETLFNLTGKPVIADDSGLSVSALDGAPGLYSARYGMQSGGEKLSAEDRNAYLLQKMEGMKKRQAFFVCSMVLKLDEYRVYTAQETLPGEIMLEASGTGGFGYDPVFYLEDYKCSLAEISEEEKNRISHRGKAGRIIDRILEELHSL